MKWLWQKQWIIDWRLWIKLHETQSINKDYRTNLWISLLLNIHSFFICNLFPLTSLTLVRAAFFFGLRPKKTQGEKTQEFKNSRKKTQTQAQQKKIRHNLTKNLHIYACSVQNFAKVVINFEEFPKNSMKFSKNSRILQKLKPKNSISGISKIFCYPECGQKKRLG